MSGRDSMAYRASRAGRTALVLCAAIGVPLFFVNSTWIAARLERLLRLEVEPSFTGGRVLAEFPDPMGDDDGPGGYAYPLGQVRERGELDLVDYVVRRPVSRPIWGASGAFWQLDAYFAKAVATGLPGGGFRAPVLHIYLQVRAAKSGAAGSTETAFGEGELIRFDPAHPWDYAISADGWSAQAEIRSADGAYRAPVLAIWDLGRRRLSLRIDLEKAPPLLASVMKGGSTWHYVLVGAYDAAREGHFAALRKGANLHDGGGAKDELAPRVFDLLAPLGTDQASELASEDAQAGVFALVEPVEAGGPAAKASDPALRGRLEAEAAKEALAAKTDRERRLAALPAPSSGDVSRVGELFDLGLEDRCLAAIGTDLSEKPSDPVALAYRGAIAAKRADRAAGIVEKVRLVTEAYRDLDAAAGSVASAIAEDRLAVFICRGNVSSAVPNDVFGRAAQGASDFDAAASIEAGLGDSASADGCLADAAVAYEKAGLRVEAGARWATLAGRKSLSGALRLLLLERGFPIEK
jgi:C-terminal binding-module, SLH-like, of glucodextranase